MLQQHVELHVYSDHAMNNRGSTSRALQGFQRSSNTNIAFQVINGQHITHEFQSMAFGTTIHYHQGTMVASPSELNIVDNTVSDGVLLRAFVGTHNSIPMQGSRVERVVLEDRPIVQYVGPSYVGPTYRRSNSPSPVAQASMLTRRRDSNVPAIINRRCEPSSSHQFNRVQVEQSGDGIEIEDREIVEMVLISRVGYS
ncbi:hypothetical protein BUALT_Bualt14G0067000 [Buddleja alternifolia]|uniref:Uncharacterized protein n=1 Tax=Buddleja alternifolia TaxID=168488 RepID=A0AAV6WSI0_9LAMI|nr:hypothetical protein BUALT_Bualt14G0067000 [Buddleja alternifolia]